jgi:hypothetical protein
METQWSVIIEILKAIADLDFQKDVWLVHKYKHPLFSFGETVNTLEDYFFFESIEQRELHLPENDHEIVAQYIKNLLSYNEPADPSLMFSDPAWINISASTKTVIDILQANTHANDNQLKNLYSLKKQ